MAENKKSEETKRKMSLAKRGKMPKNIEILKISRYNKGKGSLNSNGYKMLQIDGNGIPEHHYVWCSQSGNLPFVPKGFVIHHIDQNKLNNNPNNLFLISRSDHLKLHWGIRKQHG